MINYRKKIIFVILIFVILVLLKLNSKNNIRILKNIEELNRNLNITTVYEKTRIFCMILTQNKSLYNNRVIIHSIFHFFNEKY